MKDRGKTMKYSILIPSLIVSLLLISQIGVFSSYQKSTDKVANIAHQMRDIGSYCQTVSSAEMKKKRLQFLNDNKGATIEDLIGAIEMKIDGQDIISLLDSFNCDVCKEYADSVRLDYSRGSRAIKNNFGSTSIETVMYWRLL